jgi:hypothetical protein
MSLSGWLKFLAASIELRTGLGRNKSPLFGDISLDNGAEYEDSPS